MPGSVIVGGARTPIGKLSGALKDFPAVGPWWNCYLGRVAQSRHHR